MPSKQEELIKLYKENISVYEELTRTLRSVLSSIIEQENIKCALPIQARPKDVLSFLEKIERKKYKDPFNEMTDLAGSRIILYCENDIKYMSEIIEERFNIDPKLSINKKEQLGKNQFGFSGINYVATFLDDDPVLAEHQDYEGKYFEIQLLTLCQLVWSEMQRKIEYKIEDFVSTLLSRRLSMLSALFELADVEFQFLLTRGIEEILSKPITLRSLRIYLERSEKIDNIFLKALKDSVFTRSLPVEDITMLDELQEACSIADLRTLLDLDEFISKENNIEHLFKSIKKHEINIRCGPIMLTLLLLYHYNKEIDMTFLIKKGWNKDSIEFIIDRS